VLAQDAIAWWSQGALTDRSQEHLGRTDIPIVFLRRQLEEQIALVEQGKAPMNFFLSSEDTGDILYGSGAPPEGLMPTDWTRHQSRGAFRARYHKGFVLDDADRYGPAIPLVVELHRQIEEARLKAEAAEQASA
jgi:5,5'-dehydrodivanillate O-demethylase